MTGEVRFSSLRSSNKTIVMGLNNFEETIHYRQFFFSMNPYIILNSKFYRNFRGSKRLKKYFSIYISNSIKIESNLL